MKHLVKLVVAFCLLLLAQVHVGEFLEIRAHELSSLRNQPHRYLGLFYAAWLVAPYRSDYLLNYAAEYAKAVERDELFLEGMTKPVISMMLAKERVHFPHDKNLMAFSWALVHKNCQWNEEEEENEKLPTVSSNWDTATSTAR
jgi:hypothetical protein